MTTTTKDITNLVKIRCSSIHFLDLDRLLKRLDYEDMETLYDILEEVYDKGHEDGTYKMEKYCQGN